jgi:glycosyltransferase involved in cell wall biosynthesis
VTSDPAAQRPAPEVGRPSLLILSFSPIVSDARVLKQVRLFTADYEVTTCGYGEAPDGVAEHLRIPDELVQWRLDKVSAVLRRFERTYRRQEVVAWAADALRGREFDVVLADDVETVPLALSLSPRGGVHADLHEYAPRQKEDVPRWRLFVAPYMRWLCATYVTRADSVTTVGQGLAEEYEREFGITAAVVTNAAPYQELAPRPTPTDAPLRVVHSGAAMPDRHLEVLIDAVAAMRQDVVFDLYLARNNPDYIEQLRAHVAATAPERVRIMDPVPYRDLPATLARYDVGFYSIPPVSFNHLHSLPNKFFDFVQARLAVVIGPSPEMARLVRQHGLGVVAEGFEAADLARALDGLDPSAVDAAKQNAHRAARALSAEAQTGVWATAVERLARRAEERR